jgi:hypothetical protein
MVSQILAQWSNIVMCLSVLLIPLAFFRIRYHIIASNTARTVIDNVVDNKYSFALERYDRKMSGYAICFRPFVLLYIIEETDTHHCSIRMICSDETLIILSTNKIITGNNDNILLSQDEMKYIDHERTGTTYNCSYAKINSIANLKPTKTQEYIAQRIIERFISHQSVVAFISVY